MIPYLNSLEEVKMDNIVECFHRFNSDKSNEKINLSYGVIYNEEGKSFYFNSIKEVEKNIVETYAEKHYMLTNGTKEFSKLTQELLFGKNSLFMKEKRICTIQTIGGCGSLFLMLNFLKSLNVKTLYLTNVPYVNYPNMAKKFGFEIKNIRFYDDTIMEINYDWFLSDLYNIEDSSCILMQVIGHNPCSVNIKEEYFDKIAEVALKKKHLFIFDLAYLGLGHDKLEEDIVLIRKFQEKNISFGICKSFSKTMAIYGDRVGLIHIVCKDKNQRNKIAQHIFAMLRAYYTSPALHGNRVVCELLKNEKLKEKWLVELSELSKRIKNNRIMFFNKLEEYQKLYNLKYDWNIYRNQRGLFSYVPIIGKNYEKLRDNYHIYVVNSGRINLSGINNKNIDYIANSICKCLKESSSGN